MRGLIHDHVFKVYIIMDWGIITGTKCIKFSSSDYICVLIRLGKTFSICLGIPCYMKKLIWMYALMLQIGSIMITNYLSSSFSIFTFQLVYLSKVDFLMFTSPALKFNNLVVNTLVTFLCCLQKAKKLCDSWQILFKM